MQDRYRFRAKLKNIDNWVYGAYLKMLPYQPNPVGHRKPLETEYRHLIITEGSADWGMPREIAAYEVIPETVGQCTGLKDKNGKLIYEGDILQSEEYPFKNDRGYNYSAEVCYDEESASYFYYVVRISTNVVGRAEGNTGHLDDYEWEIIGNIYENPELLEVSSEK